LRYYAHLSHARKRFSESLYVLGVSFGVETKHFPLYDISSGHRCDRFRFNGLFRLTPRGPLLRRPGKCKDALFIAFDALRSALGRTPRSKVLNQKIFATFQDHELKATG